VTWLVLCSEAVHLLRCSSSLLLPAGKKITSVCLYKMHFIPAEVLCFHSSRSELHRSLFKENACVQLFYHRASLCNHRFCSWLSSICYQIWGARSQCQLRFCSRWRRDRRSCKAARLAENVSNSVAVIEADGFYEIGNENTSTMPHLGQVYDNAAITILHDYPSVDWEFETAPQAGLNNTRQHYFVGGR
jgi:hypothetical protein